MPIIHLTTRVEDGSTPFSNPTVATWTWSRLRALWPQALACVLMGNHPHVATPCDDPDVERQRLDAFLAELARRSGYGRNPWKPVEKPKVLGSPSKVRSELAYIWLNPCVPEFVDDPLRWRWSTYRDSVGAVFDPWTPPGRIADALGPFWRGLDDLHAFVTTDRSVSPVGTPPPVAARRQHVPEVPLGDILRAALVATRGSPSGVQRRSTTRTAFFLLARHQGWTSTKLLAEVAGVTTRAVQKVLSRTGARFDEMLAAAALCLGDERLLVPVDPPARVLRDVRFADRELQA